MHFNFKAAKGREYGATGKVVGTQIEFHFTREGRPFAWKDMDQFDAAAFTGRTQRELDSRLEVLFGSVGDQARFSTQLGVETGGGICWSLVPATEEASVKAQVSEEMQTYLEALCDA